MTKRLSTMYRNTTLSYGTLNPRDLIPAFYDFLIVQGAKPKELPCDRGSTNDEDTVVLCDLINEIAPIDFYFGSHPSEGANFGFWPLVSESEVKGETP